MAIASGSVSRYRLLRPKFFLFAAIGAMMVFVFFHNERFWFDRSDPIWEHYRPFKWWLFPHGLVGALALLLAPMQFSDRLRQRFPKFHRVVGRIYVVGVLFFVGPLGTYIQYYQERMGGTRSFTIAAAVNAALLMSTAGIGLFFILRRKIQLHRQWMTRSYAVALVFLEVRLILGVLGLDDAGPAMAELVVWACLAFAIPLADITLQIQESLRSR